MYNHKIHLFSAICCLLLTHRLHAQPATLDSTFGIQGKYAFEFPGMDTYGEAICLQPDDKIVLAGSWDSHDNGFDAMIIRLNPEGSLDTSFGVGGYFFHTASEYAEFIRNIVYHNEYLYVSGDLKDSIGDSRTVFLLKLKTDGTLDADFGNSGQASYSPVGANYLIVQDLAILPDGKMLVAGDYWYLLDNSDFMLLRFETDGSIDKSFGQNGIVHTQVEGDFNFVGSMLVQPDGKIILTGTTQYKCWCPVGGIARYEADGLLDMTFGNGGKMILDFGAYGDFEDIVLQDDGKILLTGNTYSYPPGSSSLRYTATTCRLNNLIVSTNNRPAPLQ